MGFFEYLDANPWWGMVYLVIICLAVMGSVESIFKPRSLKDEKKAKNEPKVLTEER